MEMRIYRLVCLFTAAASFIVLPINYLLDLPLCVNMIVFAFGACSYLLYSEAVVGRYRIKTFYVLLLLVLNSTWYLNGGSQGANIFFFFPAFLYAVIFFGRIERWAMFTLALTDAIALIAIEHLYPHLVVPYHTADERLGDLITGFTLSGVVSAIMLWVLRANYDSEQQRLRSLVGELRRNIAERRQAEQALRRNQELVNGILSGSTDLIYVKDREGRYLLCNHAAELQYGRSAADILGHDDAPFFPQDATAIKRREKIIMTVGKTVTYEETLTDCMGKTRNFLSTKGPIFDENGKVTGLFAVSRDITQRKEAEREIRQLNRDLDQRVKERTVELEAAIREQEAFSYSVSHDLRGPLRHINSYCAIVEEECGDALPEMVKGFLDKVRASSIKLGKVIDDLLEMSRISRSEVCREEFDFSRLATEVSDTLREIHPRRQVEVVVEEGMQVYGDHGLLTIVLQNLLGNAWKYTSKKEEARIEVGRIDGAQGAIYFVADNGTGFDMRYKDKLFSAFQRLHGAEYEGTGIGLATVKRIIDRHDGKVWAEAQVGEGATIYFTIPAGPLPEGATGLVYSVPESTSSDSSGERATASR